MKKTIVALSVIMIISLTMANGQTFKRNLESQAQRYDSQNALRSDDISYLDLVQALEYSGLKIHKLNFSQFDTTYKLSFIIEEFKNSKLTEKKVLFSCKNYYSYKDYDSVYFDYLDHVKFITKEDNNGSKIFFKTYDISSNTAPNMGTLLKRDTTDATAFYTWRDYYPLKWKLNQKTPIMLYGSSWFDKSIKQHRYCGATILEPGEEKTESLLTSSPHYYIISYIVSKN